MTRVQADLDAKTLDRIETIKTTVGATSSAQVVRDAMKIYEFLLNEAKQGNELLLRRPGSTEMVTVKLLIG